MNKSGIQAIVVGLSLFAGDAALSLTLTGNFGSNEYDNFGVPQALSNGAANAGLLALTAKYDDGSTQSIDAYCVDLYQPFLQGKTYSFTEMPFGDGGMSLSLAQQRDIKNLFEIADPVSLDFGTEKHSAGLNLALWEIVYETSGVYSLANDGGAFWVFADPNDPGNGEVEAANFAASLLAQITPGAAAVSDNYNVRFLESANHESQNLVTFTPVPLPAAGWALVSALGALVLMRRKTRAA
ncbi:VPLPA-CTERM sorting domain-containing protein [Rhodovulum marinum]|uniref:Putative secreted protein n=1 Tax=Rhodovulum marinum TaxID=320662 RepID=A0A4R2PTE3_9RHOB|nr:VPLPA-CTERM sorting domain-containing protein [Rhodovulum marinum]TCP39273.1 putative secreted protein [Rhodovulum marinum]